LREGGQWNDFNDRELAKARSSISVNFDSDLNVTIYRYKHSEKHSLQKTSVEVRMWIDLKDGQFMKAWSPSCVNWDPNPNLSILIPWHSRKLWDPITSTVDEIQINFNDEPPMPAASEIRLSFDPNSNLSSPRQSEESGGTKRFRREHQSSFVQ
jgi:hypothetical protein